jgi:putative membrane protein
MTGGILLAHLWRVSSERAPVVVEVGAMSHPSTIGAVTLAGFVAFGAAPSWAERDASAAGTSAQAFMEAAASQGQMEVELGQLAQTRSARSDVKELAGRIVKDHTNTNDELHALAKTKNMQLSTSLDSKERTRYDRLAQLSGEAFDRAYLRKILSDHEHDVTEFRRASQSSEDADVRAFAARTLVTLENHLDHARRVASGKAPSSAASEEPRGDSR